ncbi:MAG: VWA domain-containing protein [Pseudomonadota bacterium]
MNLLADLQWPLEWHWPWAFALLLLPLAFALLALRQHSRLLDYAEPALRPWAMLDRPQALAGRTLLHALAWLLLAAALAGPRLPVESHDAAAPSRHDVSVVVLLDISDSMRAIDIAPSRLERAHMKLRDLTDRLAGEALGLAVFAGTAGLVMPPSRDIDVFRFALEQSAGLLDDAPGSELAIALDATARHLPRHEASGRAIVLVTDGDADMARGNDVLSAVERLRESGVPLFILGVGTEAGAPIPDGTGGFREFEGQTWQSRMDRAALEEMAQRTGGLFVSVEDGEGDLRALASAIRALPSHPPPGPARAWNELFLWPLLAGLGILLIAYRPHSRRSELARDPTSSRASSLLRRQRSHARSALPVALLMLAGVFTLAPHEVRAEPQATPAKAYAAWSRGDFVQAQLLYARLPGAQARMGEGAAAYRRGDFNHAAQAFTTAWLLADSDMARADALYNLGNAELNSGRAERAVAAYEHVLHLRPGDTRAEANLWLARQQAEEKQMKKSRPDEPPGRRPTDVARYNEDVEADFPTEDEASGGDLSAGGPGGGQRTQGEAPALALSEADRQAAEKKMELLHDQPAPLWRAIMRQETPGRVSEGLPW